MTIAKTIKLIIAIVVVPFFFSASAKATLLQFSLTGTGTNGTIASGTFLLEDGNNSTYYTPGYFASGGIWTDGSLTLSNIPGGGPSSVTLSGIPELGGSLFAVDGGGIQYIAPEGSHSYGPPTENYYSLVGSSQPFLPLSLTFQTPLFYNGSQKDLITWSPATIVTSPEPGSLSLLLIGLMICTGIFRYRLHAAPKSA